MKLLGLNLALNPAGVNEASGVTASQGQVVSNGRLTSAATFTRSSTATYFDSDGTLQTASANEARTTYIDGVPYLLMEGARTNIVTRSEEFDHADWVKTNASVTANQTVAPDGSITADLLENTQGANSHSRAEQQRAGTAGSDYTATVFMSAGTSNYGAIRWFDNATSAVVGIAEFDLAAGTVNNTAGTVGASSIKDVGDGIYRCRITNTAGAGATQVSMAIYISEGGDIAGSAFQADSDLGDNINIWGAQHEEGAHESSYIKTTTASVTRAADSASLANSIISGLTEGTIYAEVYTDHLTSDAARHIAELESDASNFIRVLHAADGDLDAQITDGGVSQATLAGTDLTVGTLQKVALTFKEDEFSLYRGGSQLATDTGGTVPTVDNLLIGAGLHGGIKTMNVYTSRLPNAQLASMTT